MKISHCRLLKKIQLRLLEFFVLEVTARSAADILGIQPNSAALFYRKIREVIAYHLEQESHEIFDGVVELDESYFGGVRKGKRGRGAAGIVAVFGILKRGGKVYNQGCRRYEVGNVNAFDNEKNRARQHSLYRLLS